MSVLGVLLDATLAGSVLTALPLAGRAWRAAGVPATGGGTRLGRLARYPEFWLAVVVVLVYLNQALFTCYIIRVHHGNASFVGRYVPPGWFAIAGDNRVLRWLAGVLPAPGLLSVTVLRTQATLELPFGLLAYLTVCRWLDPALYRRLATGPLLVLACASYTATFCLIEAWMPNPYTVDDIAIRVVSGAVTALALRRLGRAAPAGGPVGTPGGAVAFVLAVAAFGYLVLACYDTALLYNLGHLGARLPGMLAAGAVLVAARAWAVRSPVPEPPGRPTAPGPGLDTLVTALRWWLAAFFVPALALRYSLGFGSLRLAAGAGALVVGYALYAAAREMLARVPPARRPAWYRELGVILLVAAVAGLAGLLVPADYPEVRILRAGTLAVAATIAVCAGLDRRVRASPG